MTFATSGGSEREIPLSGGRITTGVVRVGDTVRRPKTPNSAFVTGVLEHLQASSFDAAPRALGTDDLGRDVLSFIPGEVPAELSFHGDHVLGSAARLIKRLHDATATLVDSPAARRAGYEVVCHNDLSPCNFVFAGGVPAAIIDFDAASPGTRVYDLAYAAWLWLDLGSPNIAAVEQRRRLSVFLEAYGCDHAPRAALVQAITMRQTIAMTMGRQTGNGNLSAWAEACRQWVNQHRSVLETES